MKKIMIFIAVVLLGSAACSQKFEERYDKIRSDYEFLNVGAVADTIPMMVYYSGTWKAEVEEGCEWMSVDLPQGEGVKVLHVITTDNDGPVRAAELYLIAQQDTLSINVQQSGL